MKGNLKAGGLRRGGGVGWRRGGGGRKKVGVQTPCLWHPNDDNFQSKWLKAFPEKIPGSLPMVLCWSKGSLGVRNVKLTSTERLDEDVFLRVGWFKDRKPQFWNESRVGWWWALTWQTQWNVKTCRQDWCHSGMSVPAVRSQLSC